MMIRSHLHNPSRHHPLRRRRRASGGFTLLELLVVLAVILVLAALAYRGFDEMIVRSRLVGDASAIANSLQRARASALRNGKMVIGEIDADEQELVFFYNEEDEADPDELDRDDGVDLDVFPPIALSKGGQPQSSVYFWSKTTMTPDAAEAMDGFTERGANDYVIVIESDGSIRDLGGVRIGMGIQNRSDEYQGNWMEVRVVTTATGKTQIRKYIPGADVPYQPKMSDSSGTNWVFY